MTEEQRKKHYIYQCRLRLFEKLGAKLKRTAYDSWMLLYWVSMSWLPSPSTWAPSFIFYRRICDNNKGRHYNTKLNNSRWY
jgi:hypothetical protein